MIPRSIPGTEHGARRASPIPDGEQRCTSGSARQWSTALPRGRWHFRATQYGGNDQCCHCWLKRERFLRVESSFSSYCGKTMCHITL